MDFNVRGRDYSISNMLGAFSLFMGQVLMIGAYLGVYSLNKTLFSLFFIIAWRLIRKYTQSDLLIN